MPKRICIVDDHLTIRMMLRYALTFQGHDVLEAVDGTDALEKIAAHDVDMIIIDWQMPKMNGLELLQRLRQMENFVNTPIVIISSHDNIEARRQARELGALNWLKKPFRISEFQLIVERGLCDATHRHDHNRNKNTDGYS